MIYILFNSIFIRVAMEIAMKYERLYKHWEFRDKNNGSYELYVIHMIK